MINNLLRDDKAHVFAMTFKDRPLELGELAFGLLANNLRFVVQNRNESNKSRWKTCRFWERFLGAVEVLKLQVPKLHNSLEETQQWLTEGGVISAVKSFYFLEEHDVCIFFRASASHVFQRYFCFFFPVIVTDEERSHLVIFVSS